jgi:hypothetical protein
MVGTLQRHPTTKASGHTPDVMAQRLAILVAAIAGLVLVPWFWVGNGVTAFRGLEPDVGAPGQQFLEFYADNASRVPARAMVFVVMWVLILVLVVGVVRAATPRLDLAGILTISLAGAATASTVVAEGVLAWPALAFSDDAGGVAANLEPEMARAVLLSRDGLHAPAAVLVGASLLLVAWLLFRSHLWAHRVMAVLTAVVGAFAAATLMLGPESLGPGLIGPWGLVMGIILLVARHRLQRPTEEAPTS